MLAGGVTGATVLATVFVPVGYLAIRHRVRVGEAKLTASPAPVIA